MLTRRRLVLVLCLLLLAALLWVGWTVWSVRSDLQAAEGAVSDARRALSAQDEEGLRSALEEVGTRAAEAEDGTSGPTWSTLTVLPFVGDDARGVRAVSRALNLVGGQVDPLLETWQTMDTLLRDGRVDLEAVRDLRDPVGRGHRALQQAETELADVSSEGFVSALRSRYDEAVDQVHTLTEGLGAAADASELLPGMLGRDEERHYLVAFLNNAEIRGSGGMPGSFAHVRAHQGELQLVAQGAPADFGAPLEEPVLPLSKAETEIFGEQLGVYFQDANFMPDLPRAAELMAARWTQKHGRELDGVVTLDTVGMSYLLAGAGPVRTPDGVLLTPENAVTELLNSTYLNEPDPVAQDNRFRAVAGAAFEAVTTQVADQWALVEGMGRSVREGRLQVHSFRPEEQSVLTGRRIAGELTAAPSISPEVDVSFDDATASKMSYYLRYAPQVEAVSCRAGVQQLEARMPVRSVVTAEQARTLPLSVANNGQYGTDPGSQTVVVRLYGPVGGSIDAVWVEGEKIDLNVVQLGERPVMNLALLLGPEQTNDVRWTMTSGPGQDGAVHLGTTPGIEPGDLSGTVPGACS